MREDGWAMGTQVRLVYHVPVIGSNAAAMAAAIGAVPVPLDILQALGLRVTADAAPVANPVVRTIDLSFVPSAPAAATPVLNEKGEVQAIALGGDGLDYVVPPIATLADPNRQPGRTAVLAARLHVSQVAIDAPGAGYTAATVCHFLGGLPPAPRRGPQVLRSVNIKNGGRGYPAGSTVQVVGDCVRPAEIVTTFNAAGSITAVVVVDMGEGYQKTPELIVNVPMGQPAPRVRAELFAMMAGGRPARGTVNIVAGGVNAIVVTDPGDGYVTPPAVLITDPGGGANAAAHSRMGVGRIDVMSPGQYYTPAATVVITPWFQTVFPPVLGNASQRAPFWSLMQPALARAGITPVTSDPPVVT